MMNFKKKLIAFAVATIMTVAFCGCDNFTKPTGDDSSNVNQNQPEEIKPSGNDTNEPQTDETQTDDTQTDETLTETNTVDGAQAETNTVNNSQSGNAQLSAEIPEGATQIIGKITIKDAGNYYINTVIADKKISVACEGVTLYLSGATLSNEKKVIESDYGLTITLIGENTISNSNTDGSNAIDCAGDLIINGSGSLNITSTKNGIKANSITVTGATLDINAKNDGLHAEVEAYDKATSEPTPSYDDGGQVIVNNANITIKSSDDGIQADTKVWIYGANTVIGITATGKGIKAGNIDWGANDTDLDWDGYLIQIDDGTITISSTDDAIHSNGDVKINGGKLTISSGDDGVHADNDLYVKEGTVTITSSYEGLEGTNVNISGGNISIVASDDGINAAGGTDSSGFGGNDMGGWGRPGMMMGGGTANSTTSTNTSYTINISGGVIKVNAGGDGVDSNGSIYISGGELYVEGPISNDDAAIDYDGTAQITGGIVVAVGSSGMAQNFGSTSTQGSILLSLSSTSTSEVKLCQNSDVLVSYTPSKRYNSVVVSCPQLTKGNTYSLTAGGKTTSITLTSLIYGSSNGMGGNMGGMGGIGGNMGRP
jgi:hypothetical protein